MNTLTICDWKSGAFRSLEERLQLGAYWGCTHRLEQGVLLPVEERAESAHIVHVWEGGCQVETSLSEAACLTAYAKFLEAKNIFDWLVANGGASVPEQEAYRVNGRYYPSVTHILRHVIAKPALLNWSYEGGVVAGLQADAVGATPEEIAQAIAVKTRLEDKSLKRTDPDAKAWFDLTAKLHEAGLSVEAKRDGKAGQGSTIHKTILFYLQGQAVKMGEAPDWLQQALRHFSSWSSRVGLKVAYVEQKLVNEEIGYAGTCDFLGWAELKQQEVKGA